MKGKEISRTLITMKDKDKTKKQLISELLDLHQQIAKLKEAENERKRVEGERQKLEVRLRTTIESLPFDFFGLDATGRYFIQNSTSKKHFGDFVGKKPEDLSIDKHILALWLDNNRRAFSGEIVKREVEIIRAGEKRYYYHIVAPIYDKGIIEGILGFNIDITEQKRAEIAIEKLRLQNELILNSAGEGIIGLNLKGNHIFVNPSAAKILGYEVDELIGRNCHTTWHRSKTDGSPYPEEECPICDTAKNGTSYHMCKEVFWRKDGTSFSVEYSSNPIFENDKLTGAVITFRDITERNQIERALRESEERFSLIAETITEVFWIADVPIERMFYVSPGYERIWRRTRKSLYENPRSFIDVIHPEDREQVLSDLELKRTGQPFDNEYRITWPDGTIRWIWDRGFPVSNKNGQVTRYVGVAQDITERKKAEERLGEREKELEIKAHSLEEANIALKVLLKRRDEDRTELEDMILINIKELIAPYLEKLEMSGLGEKQKTYVSILESNLNQIISPFAHKLSSKFLNFTPTEIQVANLLRQGKTSKEMSELLNCSPRNIAFHRDNIRKKLGLKNKKTNLKSYLSLLH